MNKNEKIKVIEKASKLLLNNNKEDALEIINNEYKFEYKKIEKRNYSDREKLKIFIRDGFIDRYSGEKLLNPGILKVFSIYFPKEFPYHRNWKINETHIAYWELVPTINHINPVAIGGKDEDDNIITTSQLNNSIKSNWTLEQLKWKIYDAGDIKEWDGLTKTFIELVENDITLLSDNYIKKWYSISKSFIKEGEYI